MSSYLNSKVKMLTKLVKIMKTCKFVRNALHFLFLYFYINFKIEYKIPHYFIYLQKKKSLLELTFIFYQRLKFKLLRQWIFILK